MKRTVAFIAILSLVTAATSASAQEMGGLQYYGGYVPSKNRGATIGVDYERQLYQQDGMTVYRVTAVDPNSPFFALKPGDLIYSADRYLFRDASDLENILAIHTPGQMVAIYYLDAANGYEKRAQTAQLTTPVLMAREAIPAPAYVPPPNRPPANPDPARMHPVASSAAADQATLNRTLNAIVIEDSPGWWSGTYDQGSLHDAHVRATEADGTSIIRGSFTYNHGTEGWVDARVKGRSLVCVDYSSSFRGCHAVYDPNQTSHTGLLVGAFVVAAVAVIMLSHQGSGGHGSSDQAAGEISSSEGQDEIGGIIPASPTPVVKKDPPEDTSVGCVWGDRIYNTCH